MLAHEFEGAVANAPPGVKIRYYTGHLVHDVYCEVGLVTKPRKDGSRPIGDLGRAVWQAYAAGLGFPLQARVQHFRPGSARNKEAPPMWDYYFMVASEEYRKGNP